MTTTAAFPARATPARTGSPAVVAARYLLEGYLVVGIWFALGVLTIGALVPLVVSRFGDVGFSLVEVSWQAGVWFCFSLNASFGAGYFPAHLGFGMTRRSYWQGVLLAALVFAAVLTAFQTGALALERWWYGAMGWSGGDVGALVVGGEGWAATAGRYLLLYLGALVAGALVSLTYARFGAWVGTLCLPLTVGPLLVVGGLLVSIGGGGPLEALGVAGPVAAGGALGLVVLLAAALVVLVRGFRLIAPPR